MTTNRKSPFVSLRSIKDVEGTINTERIFNLASLYELGMERTSEEHIQRMGVHHPSAVGMCKRAQFWQFLRVAPTDTTGKKLQAIFDTGHIIHDMVQNNLESLGVKLAQHGLGYEFRREVSYDPKTDELYAEWKIGGTCDGVLSIWDEHNEQRGVVEIKSQNDDRHEELIKRPGAWPKHLMQAHIYAFRFDCPIIWVFYINKNNSAHHVKLHLFDWAIFDAAINYFVELEGYITRNELPPREESYLECKDCPYRTKCQPPKFKRMNLPPVPKISRRRKL